MKTAEGHPTGRELKAFAFGIASKALRRRVEAHVASGCDGCVRLLRELAAGAEVRPRPVDEGRWGPAWHEVVAGSAGKGQERVDELRGHPPGRRVMLVRGAQRYQSLETIGALCRESRGLLGDDPDEAVGLARLAVTVARLLDAESYPSGLVADYLARAWTRLAHAQRRASGLKACEASLRTAERVLEEGTGDPLERAELCHVRGMLRSDQGLGEEALEWLEESAAHFDEAGDCQMLGIVMMDQGVVLAEMGRYEEASRKVLGSVWLVESGREARLFLVVFHNIALYLTELGYVDSALSLLRMAKPLYEAVGQKSVDLRRLWLEAKLLGQLGWSAEAERKLGRAREGFAEMGWLLETAQILLEEALIAEPQRRLELLADLCGDLLPALRQLGLEREATAALQLLEREVTGRMRAAVLDSTIQAAIEALRGRKRNR